MLCNHAVKKGRKSVYCYVIDALRNISRMQSVNYVSGVVTAKQVV